MGGSKRRYRITRAITRAALAAAVLFAAGTEAAAREPYRMLSKSWELGSVDVGGAFSHCKISAVYGSGRVMYFSANQYGRFSLVVSETDWNLEPDSLYPGTLSIDGRHLGDFELKAIIANAIIVELPHTDRFDEALKQGRQLDVRFMETTYSFALTGTRAGLEQMERCVAEGIAREAGAPDKMISRSWELNDHVDESSGSFTHCMITADYGSSRSLFFILGRDNLFQIYIFDTRMELDKEARYPATLSIDDRDIGEYETEVMNEKGLGMTLPYTDGIFNAFKHGRQVAIGMDGKTFKFSLTGTLVGLTDLERCVAQRLQTGTGGRRNPYQNNQAAPSAAAEQQSARSDMPQAAPVLDQGAQVRADRRRFFNAGADDDWAFINRLLDSVGLWDFEFVPLDGWKQDSRNFSYTWGSDSVSGAVHVVKKGNRAGFDFVSSQIANYEKRCDDAFDNDVREAKMASGAKAWRVFGGCSLDDRPQVVGFLTIAYQDAIIYIINAGDKGDIDVVRDADNRLFGWFQATF